jgi:predicted N-acyltransferase
MRTSALTSITEISAQAWNALLPGHDPFLRYEFLSALERNDCVGSRTGWLPRHIVCHDGEGQLAAASPMYVKTNSYGEFVFDWSWAEAYERHGLRY